MGGIARYKEDKADLESGMVTQCLEYHRGEKPQFKRDVVQKFKKPMQRQIAEAVYIDCSSDHVIMKRKS